MKKIKILSLILFSFMIYMFALTPKRANAYTQSKSEICIEVKTGLILHKYNENQKLPIASTTKILTCITALENCDINSEILVKKDTCNIEGSSIYLKEGEKYTLNSLLYGLMLRSGNDSAETIADFIGGRDNFIKLMNKTAEKIGCLNSNFVNPHGLHENNHYSSALDLAKITSYSLKNTKFREIVSTKKIIIEELTEGQKIVLYNKNKMLNLIDGASGVKTGYTKVAGRCLVSSCKRGDIELVCVVINSPQMFERSCEILENCFKNFSFNDVLEKEFI